MSDIAIRIDCLAGCDCNDLIRQMCELASRVGVDVQCRLNDVEVRAVPTCDVKELCQAWHAEMTSNRPYKFVMGKVAT